MLPFVYSIAHLRKLPFVLWTGMWHHPRTLSRRLTQPLVNGIFREADAIVIYGEHVRRYLTEVNGVDPHKLFVAGVAIESSRFASAQPTFDEPPVVLYVGRLEEVKGLDILLAAAKRVEASFGLRLIGGGSLANELREAWVEVIGPLTQDELPEELERARCLVLPSVTTAGDRETWGLVVNEAMTAGLPVIATEAVGAAAAGLVVDGRNGFVVPERDPSALADAIRRLVSDAQLARRFGEQARADVARLQFNEAMADAFEAAIEYAIERRGI